MAELLFDFNPGVTELKDVDPEQIVSYRNAIWLTTFLANPVAAVVAVLTFMQLFERRGIEVLNFRKRIVSRHIWFLVALGIASVGGSFLVQYANEEILQAFGSLREELDEISQQSQEKVNVLLSGGTQSFIINVLLLAVLVPIGEEFIFRGGVQRYFIQASKRIGPGILVSAFVFALIHAEFDGFLVRFGMGVLLGYVYVFTRNIWASVLLHGVYNFTTLCVSHADRKGWISEEMGIIIPVTGLAITGILVLFMWKKNPLLNRNG